MDYISFLYFNYCCKGLKWKKENEYRLIYANSKQESDGKLVSYNDLNIIAKQIFISTNCSDEDKKELEEIAKELHIAYKYVKKNGVW